MAPHTRRKPVRKPLPPELPRVVIELTPPEVQRAPQDFHYIGCDTREVLERRPAATVVVQLVYKKFVANDSQVPPSCQSHRYSPGHNKAAVDQFLGVINLKARPYIFACKHEIPIETNVHFRVLDAFRNHGILPLALLH